MSLCVAESGVVRPQYAKLQAVLAKHGAVVGSGPPPAPPPVAAFPPITMRQALPLLDAAVLAALTPQPIASPTPRGMEELGIGYGYALYSTTLPEPQVRHGRKACALSIHRSTKKKKRRFEITFEKKYNA